MPSWICPAGTMVLLILAPAIFTFATMHSPMVWFGSSISEFVIDLHWWFKMPYEAGQEEMGLAKHKFLKHVECRWLSLQPAVLRILEQLEGLKRYFLTVLPEKQPSVKSIQQYIRITRQLQSDDLVAQMHFSISVADILNSFLSFPEWRASHSPTLWLTYHSPGNADGKVHQERTFNKQACQRILKNQLGSLWKPFGIQRIGNW